MEPITVKGFDGAEYVVSAIPWIQKNEINGTCSDINIFTQKVSFDKSLYTKKMFLACVKKNGSPLTEVELASIDGKTGDALDTVIHMLNDLSAMERLNLQNPPSPITQQTQSLPNTK